MTDHLPLSEQKIRDALPASLCSCPLILFDSTDSTNNRAKELIQKNAAHGTLLLAEEQTAGRGRTGKSFYSPKGTGLYMSVILRPEKITDAQLLTVFTAVAVSEAIESLTGLSPKIKWVNDLYLNGKKICGILCEACGGAFVVGVGVNCRTEIFPNELSAKAGSLNTALSRNLLAARIYERLFSPHENILFDYKTRSLMLGKEITYQKSGVTYTADVLDINEKGNLVVRKKTGETETLTSGEVSVNGHW